METVPLPELLRPKVLSEFVGQKPLVGKEGVIRRLLVSAKKSGFFPSLIFWGPPGSGKTTLARIIASELKRPYHEFSAVSSSIKETENPSFEVISPLLSRTRVVLLERLKDPELNKIAQRGIKHLKVRMGSNALK